MKRSSRGRWVLVGIAIVFAIPLVVAFVLRGTGWQPARTVQSGILVQPQRDISAAPVTLADGSRYAWRDPQFRWTLVFLPGTDCASQCRARLDEALRMRITLGRNADRLRVLYLGPALPKDFLAVRAPLVAGRDDRGVFAFARAQGSDALALALVDPRGQLMLRYADGYSAQGLRRDVVKILY
ncbi:MAG: hypothetical protein JSS28_06915 [Proteobacteria bacterium]|nr:hypothetical protein [Pseudomonadota bacterium]